MLMMKERRTAFRTIEGWARSVLLEGGAIRGCEKHGWMKDWADPHARERALLVAARMLRPASPRRQQWPRSKTCSARSATPARMPRLMPARRTCAAFAEDSFAAVSLAVFFPSIGMSISFCSADALRDFLPFAGGRWLCSF